MRSVVRLAFLAAFAFALLGCGGGESGESEAEQAQRLAAQNEQLRQAAEERWRGSFREWSASMTSPALGVSAVMGDDASLTAVLDEDPATRRRLNTAPERSAGLHEAA